MTAPRTSRRTHRCSATDPNAAIAGPFPIVAQTGSVNVQTTEPDQTTVPVNYNVAAQSNRHGGAQVVRPTHNQATITDNGVGLGLILPRANLSSAFIEANMMVSGVGFDLFGDPFNSSADFSNSKGYFADDGNAPPYHIGFRYLYHCAPTQPAGLQREHGHDGRRVRRISRRQQLGSAGQRHRAGRRVRRDVAAPAGLRGDRAAHQRDGVPERQRRRHGVGPDRPLRRDRQQLGHSIPAGYTVGTTSIGTYPLNPLGPVQAGCPT